MAEPQLAQRMDTLEDYMRELSYQSLKTEMEVAQLSREMKDFKDEMRVFKDEMKDFKDEMSAFKDEMIDFKDEMRTFREESERDRRKMNRRWGELANKMGTLAEDIVAPNLPRVARELLGCEIVELFTVRMRKEVQGRRAEYDVLVVCPDSVWINETKSSLRSRDVDELVDKLGEFRDFFPEYRDRKLVGVLASLSADESMVRRASASGILVMAMGAETMDVLNPESLKVY